MKKYRPQTGLKDRWGFSMCNCKEIKPLKKVVKASSNALAHQELMRYILSPEFMNHITEYKKDPDSYSQSAYICPAMLRRALLNIKVEM